MREHLHIRLGEKVAVALLPDGRLALKAAHERPDIGRARGILHRRGQRVVTLEEMQDAVERANDA